MCGKKLFIFFSCCSTVSTQRSDFFVYDETIFAKVALLSSLTYFAFVGPKLLDRFDSLHEEKKSSASGNDSEGNVFGLEAFGKIFEGLADCLTSPRKTSKVPKKTSSCQLGYCNWMINTAFG